MNDWDFPSPFTLALTPAAEHIDGLAHTNNAVYVQWCEQAGWAHSEALGLSLDDYRRLDRAMAIREGHYDYLLPSFEGEALVLGTWLTASDGKLTMERRFQLRRASDAGARPLGVGLHRDQQRAAQAHAGGVPERLRGGGGGLAGLIYVSYTKRI
jgi:acyl-CoA thioester hydrolase